MFFLFHLIIFLLGRSNVAWGWRLIFISRKSNIFQVRYLLQLLSGVAWCERSADGRRVVWAGHSTIVVRRLYEQRSLYQRKSHGVCLASTDGGRQYRRSATDSDLGRFRLRNQRTNPNPDLIPDSESCVVESDLESESCRFKSESDSEVADSESESSVRFRFWIHTFWIGNKN